MRRRLLAFAALPILVGGIARAANPAVAILPFENLTGDPGAPARVARGVAAALAKRGCKIVDGAPVEEALDAARLRYVDAIDSAA
ncbi:MAG TPA: hypothetical protein VG777_01340, partial [Thermoanaerobaculia bacterium]|nr:hypothetical protein [Thermoanaerobaculia bacterium]